MKRSPLLVVFVTIFIDLVSFGIVIPLLPFYAQNFGASGFVIGLLLSIFSLMSFIFMPLWGRLSDRFGRRPILMMTIFGSVMAYLIFSSAFALWMLFLSRILAGIANANISVAQAYISDVTSPEDRAKGMGLVGAAFGLGFVFGPMIGSLFSSESFGEMRYALPGWIAAGLSVVNLVMTYFLLPESLSEANRTEVKNRKIVDIQALRLALGKRNLGLAMMLLFIATIGFSSIYASFPLFIMEKPFNLDSSGMGWFFVEIGVFSVIIQGGLIGKLTSRFGERKLIHVGAVLMTVGFIGFPLSSYAAHGSLIFLGVATALLSIGSSCLAPTTMSLTSQMADATEQGSILGITQSFASLGRMLGPAIGGAAYDFAGHASPYYFAFTLMLIAIIMSYELLKREISVKSEPLTADAL